MIKYLIFIVALFALCTTTSFATVEEDQQRLEELKQQLEQQNVQMQNQKEMIQVMEKKIECNYSLLQSYNKCEEANPKNTPEYVECMQRAKAENSCS